MDAETDIKDLVAADVVGVGMEFLRRVRGVEVCHVERLLSEKNISVRDGTRTRTPFGQRF